MYSYLLCAILLAVVGSWFAVRDNVSLVCHVAYPLPYNNSVYRSCSHVSMRVCVCVWVGGCLRHFLRYLFIMGTAVALWLRCCATNRKVAGLIPAAVSGFFIDIKSFRSHYGPGVDLAFNRNEYWEYLLGVKAAGA